MCGDKHETCLNIVAVLSRCGESSPQRNTRGDGGPRFRGDAAVGCGGAGWHTKKNENRVVGPAGVGVLGGAPLIKFAAGLLTRVALDPHCIFSMFFIVFRTSTFSVVDGFWDKFSGHFFNCCRCLPIKCNLWGGTK